MDTTLERETMAIRTLSELNCPKTKLLKKLHSGETSMQNCFCKERKGLLKKRKRALCHREH